MRPIFSIIPAVEFVVRWISVFTSYDVVAGDQYHTVRAAATSLGSLVAAGQVAHFDLGT